MAKYNELKAQIQALDRRNYELRQQLKRVENNAVWHCVEMIPLRDLRYSPYPIEKYARELVQRKIEMKLNLPRGSLDRAVYEAHFNEATQMLEVRMAVTDMGSL